jgi:hypothetical protein
VSGEFALPCPYTGSVQYDGQSCVIEAKWVLAAYDNQSGTVRLPLELDGGTALWAMKAAVEKAKHSLHTLRERAAVLSRAHGPVLSYPLSVCLPPGVTVCSAESGEPVLPRWSADLSHLVVAPKTYLRIRPPPTPAPSADSKAGDGKVEDTLTEYSIVMDVNIPMSDSEYTALYQVSEYSGLCCAVLCCAVLCCAVIGDW